MFDSKRKHPRLAVSLPIKIESFGVAYEATATELGGGGMALAHADQLAVAQPVRVALDLPGSGSLRIQAVVWWKKSNLIGLRFDPSDRSRPAIEKFVAAQLEEISNSE